VKGRRCEGEKGRSKRSEDRSGTKCSVDSGISKRREDSVKRNKKFRAARLESQFFLKMFVSSPAYGELIS